MTLPYKNAFVIPVGANGRLYNAVILCQTLPSAHRISHRKTISGK